MYPAHHERGLLLALQELGVDQIYFEVLNSVDRQKIKRMNDNLRYLLDPHHRTVWWSRFLTWGHCVQHRRDRTYCG